MVATVQQRVMSRFDGTGRGIAAAFVAHERRRSYVVSETDGLLVFDLDTGSSTQLAPQSFQIRGLTPSPWGSYFAAWGGSLRRWPMTGEGELPLLASTLPLTSATPLE